MTEKMYMRRPYQRTFTARVVSQAKTDSGWEAVLERTLFYPTSGGQPHDMGRLGGVAVVDVLERDGEIVHRLAGGPLPRRVKGELDWDRRFDHMQQHTGQHILSQAFEQELGLHTVAFHMSRDVTTVDLDTASLSPEQVAQAEDLANRVAFEDRPVRSYFVSSAESAEMDLRKLAARQGDVRIVEVEAFDRIPCGGTHCRRTGEVGLIKVIRWERRGAETRVEFVCGGRALADYRWKNRALYEAADALSTRAHELPQAVAKALADRDALWREMEDLRQQLLDYEAAALTAHAEPAGGVQVVRAVFADRKPDELKWLAQRITAAAPRVVLLGSKGEKGHMVFARSAGVNADAAVLLRLAAAAVGGRGGGRPELAQGGVPPDRLEEAIDAALRGLTDGG
ncbi:MAG: DHHA1 domain-containing protein [Chloroflexi bacterium]|nr:DHHA1 domain-containing protein [Chloroflexota bacterium]MCL5026953.1 DHHA1 domain-containing protein [Chloroflexota bacterium]